MAGAEAPARGPRKATARHKKVILRVHVPKWEFPKMRGTLFWGPYNKDPTI